MRKQITLVLMLLLSGCVSSRYMGVPLAAGETDPVIRELAIRARGGDKQAQLDLGIRFEEGRGVPKDVRKAVNLYRLAAEDGSWIWIYVPSAGGGASAHVERVKRHTPGLAEARERLSRIQP